MNRFGLAFTIVCLLSSSVVFAQSSPIQGEFIESSSPLPDGGRVTTRSEPGRRVQTTVTIAALPNNPNSSRNFGNASSVGQNNPAGAGSSSGSSSAGSNSRSSSVLSGAAQGGQAGNSSTGYPYPATYPANSGRVPVRVASLPANSAQAGAANVNGQVNVARAQLQTNNCCVPVTNCCTPVQGNGLGLTPAPNFGPAANSLPALGTRQGGLFQRFQQPVLPQAGFQQPGLVGGVQPTLSQAPQFGLGQVGANNIGTGSLLGGAGRASSVYQPLLPLLNMPQGSYLGQGIIGQPEAYVSTQPIRNFFRYLFPF